jgi:hypothetical protein
MYSVYDTMMDEWVEKGSDVCRETIAAAVRQVARIDAGHSSGVYPSANVYYQRQAAVELIELVQAAMTREASK